jgi:DNA-binding transcriptional ArsR family regulator
MNIIKNEAVDFIFAFRRFGIRNNNNTNEYPGLEELENWCSTYQKKLSPFLINDISILSEKTIIVSLFLFDTIAKNPSILTATDFINTIKEIPANSFKENIIKNFLNKDFDEITVENIYNAIVNDGLHPGYEIREEAELLFGFLNEPEDFLFRLYSTLSQFYKQVYTPSKESFDKLYNEKYTWHNKLFLADKKSYLTSLGLNSLINEYPNLDELKFYFSLFLDDDVFALWNNKSVIIGAATDTRIIQQSAKTKSDLFFNCLGDPKRLEIIRLTSQKPWYSTELANHFNLKPATLSYHINILVQADLLRITKGDGKRLYYTLNKEALKTYLEFVSQDLLGLINLE